MAFEVTSAPAPSAGFEIASASAASQAFAVEPVAAPPAPAAGAFGGFIQWRVNGVDLGDNRVGVVDFVSD